MVLGLGNTKGLRLGSAVASSSRDCPSGTIKKLRVWVGRRDGHHSPP